MTRADKTVNTFSALVPTAAIKCSRAVNADPRQDLFATGVGLDRQPATLERRVHALRVAIDHHERRALLLQFLADDEADAARAADNEMFFELIQHARKPTLLPPPRQTALDNQGRDQGGRVERGADASGDQEHLCNKLTRARQRVDFTIADGGHRGHRHVERVPGPPSFDQDIARGAAGENQEQQPPDGEPRSPPVRSTHPGGCASGRIVPPPPGAIPTSPLLRGTTPFRLSPWALGTQQLVSFRCLASPLAASTPLLALERLILTPRIQIRPLALQRFCLTPPAQKTRPMEQPRLNLTIPARTIRLSAHSRCLATRKAQTTRPTVVKRFLATLRAMPTRPPG